MNDSIFLKESSEISQASTIEQLGSLVDDYALRSCIEQHLFATVQIVNSNDASTLPTELDLIASNFDVDQMRMIDSKQIAELVSNHISGAEIFLPKFWCDSESRWKKFTSISNTHWVKSPAKPSKQSVALLSSLGSQKFALFAASKKSFNSEEQISLFHSLGMRFFDQLNKIGQTPQKSILSKSERNCLVWSACGKTSSEISLILSLSEHTVNHYFTVAASKLKANNRTHAIAKAIRLGLIRFDEIK